MSHTLTHYLIDTHTHINFPDYDDDLAEVLKWAKESGVGKLLAVGTDLATNEQVLKLSSLHKNIWSTVGYHPTHITDDNVGQFGYILSKLDNQIRNDRVAAVGEIGLDFFRMKGGKEPQIEIFKEMLYLAKINRLPVIIHCRDAFDETFEVLEEYKGILTGVIHCFTGNLEQAKRAIDLGYLIGFTGLITYTKDEDILNAVKEIDLEKILIETDCPYLTPAPMRGRRNEPANVFYVAKKIAELKNLDIEMVAEVTSKNAERLFGLE